MKEEREKSRGRQGRSSKHTEEFCRDAVAMVLDEGNSIAEVARRLGVVSETSLGKWVRQERIERGERDGLTRSERDELVELRRENRRLTMERDLLKRATAFWVKEATP